MNHPGIKRRDAPIPAERRRSLIAYALAFGMPPLLLLLRFLTGFPLGDIPDSFLFLIPVLLGSFTGGPGPGLAALILSAACSSYLPHGTARLVFSAGTAASSRWAEAVLVGAMSTALISLLRRRNRGMLRDLETHRHVSRKLSGIVASAPMVLYAARLGPEGRMRFTYMSPVIRDLLGIGAEEAMEDIEKIVSLVHPDDLSRLKESIFESARSLQPWLEEFRMRPPDGKELWVEASSVPQREPDGGIVWFGYTANVTKRRRMEALLRDAQKIAHFGGWEMDVGTMKLTWSDEVYRIYGVDPDRVEPNFERYLECVHPEDRAGQRRHLETVIGEKRFPDFECRILRPDGTVRTVYIRGTVILNRTGDVATATGTVQDISERKAMETALRESEEHFKTVFQSGPQPYGLSDIGTGVFLDVNEKFLRLFGYAREEMIGHSSRELGLWADPEIRDSIVGRMHSYNEVQEVQTKFVTKGGQIRDTLWSATKLRLGGRDVLLGILYDQTDRIRAEREVRAWRERYELVAEASSMVFYDICPEQDRILWSRSVGKVLGIDGTGKTGSISALVERIHPEDREGTLEAIEKARKGSGFFDLEHRIRGADGSYLTFHNRGFPLRDEGSDTMHLVGVAEDVTERKRAEEARHLMAHTVESIAEAVTLTDLDGNLTFVNQAFREAYGYDPRDVYGREISMLWTPGKQADLIGKMRADPQCGSWRGEVTAISKDGREFPVALRISRIHDEDNVAIGYAAIHEDITERRRLEEQLLQARKMEAVGRLAGGVAHDYNNMTGVILGFATLLSERIDPADPMHEDVAEILSAAQRSANLTRQLLAFARKQVVAPVPLDLSQSVQSLRKVIQRLIGEDVALRIATQDGLWAVLLDPAQVDQILANLASNARDAIRDVGTVFVGTSNVALDASAVHGIPDGRPGEFVMLQFSDTGRGMDEAERAKVFEPFYAEKPQNPGTGLGLATVFGIVKQNDGFLSVDSAVDRGTTFRLYFPRHAGTSAEGAPAATARPAGGGETILLVEDEELLLELARKTLQKYGYGVLAVRSPLDAIALCRWRKEPIDLLLTDVIMPEMNGKDMNAAIQEVRPGLKTLFMSGYPADVIADRGFLEEGIQFIQKPFRPSDLVEKIRKVLGDA